MRQLETLGEALERRGFSRRAFLKYGSYVASLMALPPSAPRRSPKGWRRRGVSR